MMGVILAIDPGNVESGYVICSYTENGIQQVSHFGKVSNEELLERCKNTGCYVKVAIEMVACYGMPVGREVFDTCVWIGRFQEAIGRPVQYIYRKDEKMDLCHSMKANDATIRQALVDRYAPGERNYGKGTKAHPGFFYGFKADIWAAMAVATTFFDKYIKGESDNG